jgi:Skp family chaperone for outer membrane proteins
LSAVDAQIKPLNDKLKTSVARYQALSKEIQDSQKNPAIKRETLQPKIDELQALEVQIKRDQEDGKARYSRAYQSTVGPIFNDILKALNEFAKKNGYAVILDGAKLEQAQILLGFDEKYDVTKDFVTYYNTRPAGTATAAAPK